MDEATQSSSDLSDVDSTPLDLNDDLFDVKRELISVAGNWKNIGIALRLKRTQLDYIQTVNDGNPNACLTSVVIEWLNRKYNVKRFGEPTWQFLVEALGDPAVGVSMELARNIARRHKAKNGSNKEATSKNVRKRKAESGPNILARKKVNVGDAQPSSGTIPPQTSDQKSHNIINVQQEPSTSAEVTFEGWPTTTTAAADEKYAEKIEKLVIKRPLVLVTAGISGTGKSTLINNLLGLKGEKAAKTKFSLVSVTKSVNYYEKEVHGITVHIIDTPGLDAKDLSSKEVEKELATLSVLTNGKADLLLYCMKLTDRSDYRDERIVMKLTKTFGKEIWKHTILVFTFGDVVLKQDEEDRDLLEEFTEDFEQALKKAGVSDIPVKSILSTKDNEVESAQTKIQHPEIIGIPVGQHTCIPQNWTNLLFKEIIKRCEFDAVPAILMLQGIPPEWVAKVLMGISRLIGGGVVGCGVGSVVGMGIGAAVGTTLGGVGAVPGAAVGAAIGESMGILAGMFVGGTSNMWCVDELTGLVKIIKARKRLEELKKEEKYGK